MKGAEIPSLIARWPRLSLHPGWRRRPSTSAPGCTLYWPAVITCCPGDRPSIDHRAAVDRIRHLDPAQLGLVVRIDRIGIEPVGAVLDRIVGNDGGVLQRLDQQARGNRLARPQRMVLVVEHRLQPDRAARRVDLVVDQRERAGRTAPCCRRSTCAITFGGEAASAALISGN